MDSLCPLDHLYVSRVKRFLASCTLCQSWLKGVEIVKICGFFLKILYEIHAFVRGRCVSSYYGECLLPFSCTPILWPCLHTLCLSSIYIWWCMSSPTFTCVVSFLSLYTCFLLLVCNLLFLFHTKMPWWVLFKVFQKYRLSKFSCHKLSSCKVFQEFVLG